MTDAEWLEYCESLHRRTASEKLASSPPCYYAGIKARWLQLVGMCGKLQWEHREEIKALRAEMHKLASGTHLVGTS